jgi:hypothetical protein
MRYTKLDVGYWTNHVNHILESNGKKLLKTRQHGSGSGLTVIEQVDSNGLAERDPIYAGTKREVVEYLQAMVRMHRLLAED